MRETLATCRRACGQSNLPGVHDIAMRTQAHPGTDRHVERATTQVIFGVKCWRSVWDEFRTLADPRRMTASAAEDQLGCGTIRHFLREAHAHGQRCRISPSVIGGLLRLPSVACGSRTGRCRRAQRRAAAHGGARGQNCCSCRRTRPRAAPARATRGVRIQRRCRRPHAVVTHAASGSSPIDAVAGANVWFAGLLGHCW